MIADLKPYPSMKNSGVSWLGEVPEHWQVRRLKTLCSRSALYGANVGCDIVYNSRCSISSDDGHHRGWTTQWPRSVSATGIG